MKQPPLQILLVEDSAGDARLISEMFRREQPGSVVVTHVSCLADAVKQLLIGAIDIVLLDMGLPDAHGLETIRRAQAAAPDVPIIVLTGLDDEKLADQAMKQGAQDYLIKGQIENRALPRALRYAVERQRTQVEVRARTEELGHSLIKIQTLLREIHHRVKNNLQIISSLLSMQSETLDNSDTVAALKVCQQRVNSMALIHELLYSGEDIEEIDFAVFTQSLLDLLFGAYLSEASRVVANVKLDRVLLKIDQAIPCGLILNELVTNALKYAHPGGQSGEIAVELSETRSGEVRLTISDDGVGLPKALDWKNSNTLGLPIVNRLVEQIGGTLTVEHERGSKFVIVFPKDEIFMETISPVTGSADEHLEFPLSV
jgi:two-component sensor histidine kinase